MNKRRWFPVFLVFVCFAAVPGLAQSQQIQQNQEQVKTIFSFKSDLGITDDQELKLKALLYDEQAFLDQENSSLKTLGGDLNKMIADKADMQAIKGKLEEISKAQVDISYRNIEDGRKVETILTPDQLTKWRDIQNKFASQAKKETP